jgi:hypothetical protein
MVKQLVLWAFAVGLSGQAQALESTLLDKVQTLPTEYRIVIPCGDWQVEGRAGYYRVIVADVYQGAGSELYVQWVEPATQQKPASVWKTVAVSELNNDHAQYQVESARCETKGRQAQLRVRAVYEHDPPDRVRDISIRLIDAGRYSLRQQVRPLRSPVP